MAYETSNITRRKRERIRGLEHDWMITPESEGIDPNTGDTIVEDIDPNTGASYYSSEEVDDYGYEGSTPTYPFSDKVVNPNTGQPFSDESVKRGSEVLDSVELPPARLEGDDYMRMLNEKIMKMQPREGRGLAAPPEGYVPRDKGSSFSLNEGINKHYGGIERMFEQNPDLRNRMANKAMWDQSRVTNPRAHLREGQFSPDLVAFAKGLFSDVGGAVKKGKDAAGTTARNVMDWLEGLK